LLALYATNNQAKPGASVEHTGGTVKTETLQTLLEQASAQLTRIAEWKRSAEPGFSDSDGGADVSAV
jgi:hypothetical protein